MTRTIDAILVALCLILSMNFAACGDDEITSGQEQTPETITIAITAPVDDSCLNGVMQIEVAITGEVVQVDLVVDDTVVSTSTTPPFTFEWDTAALTEAEHLVQAVAHGAQGTQVTSEVCQITIDRTAPTVSFSDAELPVLFSDEQSVPIDTQDANGVAEVRLLVDDVEQAVITEPPFEFTWDTTGLPDGAVVLAIEAEDRAGNVSRSEMTGVVVNGGLEPQYVEENLITWTIPGNWRVVEYHYRLHFEMPAGITHIMAVMQWDQPDWELQLAIGTGICPHRGVRYAYAEDTGGQVVVTHSAEELSLSEYPQGETWFLHLAPGPELDNAEALDAIMLQSTDVAFTAILY